MPADPPPDKKVCAADICTHCGFCLTTCPTYRVEKNELHSPRGRLALILALNANELTPKEAAEGLSTCLLCRACNPACPAGVKPGNLILRSRALLPRHPPLSHRLFHWLIVGPRRTRWAAALVRLYHTSGMRRLLHATRLLRLAPALARWEGLIPWQESSSSLPAMPPIPHPPRLRVGLLGGCMARLFYPDVAEWTQRLFAALGVEAVPLGGFGCCGAPFREQGDRKRFLRQARRTLDAFARAGPLDGVVCDSAICAVTGQSYGRALEKDPRYAEQAARFAKLVKPFEVLLEEQGAATRLKWHDPGLGRMTWQDHCQTRHGLGILEQPRRLLAAIPAEVVALPGADQCCGAGGEYMLLHPERSQAIRADKLTALADSGATCVTGSNPGCLMHLQAGLREQGASTRVLHLANLLGLALTERKSHIPGEP